ncbi:hypothetical protein [Corynebacterium anserum]|uniref:Uncharacterized protein n=1 Tax=Corynebacterium anserum TaxID=2684406 RepID=A0A7G7YQC3_9CORY|nr:hypothetical protein [Corynebacterium anserum]MBC2682374.1 hypothetical protein [Corynebacterium anserum]QNH96693.1 hypothetical protein GP473_08555 [Corynebacterium anserum]
MVKRTVSTKPFAFNIAVPPLDVVHKYKFYLWWRDAPLKAGVPTVSGNRDVSRREQKNVEFQCNGDVMTTFIGNTKGTIVSNGETFHAYANSNVFKEAQRSLQSIMRFVNRKNKSAAVFVLFKRNNESLSEEFAGLARTEMEAYSLAKILDSDTAHYLFERVELEGWEGEVTERFSPEVVYLAFREGREQGKQLSGRGLDPEILGASTTKATAQELIEQRRGDYPITTQFNIWRVTFGLQDD